MTDKIKSILHSDVPNWALWLFSVSIMALVGVISFSATAAADAHNDARYILKAESTREWSDHKEKDSIKVAAIVAQVDRLENQLAKATEMLSRNNDITIRNNAILERLDKK